MFLEDEMIRGSMVPREISLDKKWVCAPTPMIQEPFFSIPAVVATPVVATPVGDTPSAAVSEPETPLLQWRLKFLLQHMRSQNSLLKQRAVPVSLLKNLLEGHSETENQLYLLIMNFI